MSNSSYDPESPDHISEECGDDITQKESGGEKYTENPVNFDEFIITSSASNVTTTAGFVQNDTVLVGTRDVEVVPTISFRESLLNDSRITPTGNGSPSSKPYCTQPNSGHKWWASILLGFIFAIVSSPAAYYVSSKVTTSLGGISTTDGPGPNFVGLLIHTLVFIIIIRIILW